MRRTLLLGILLGILISVVGGMILVSTMPSDDEIQRISFEEFGLDGENQLIAGLLEPLIAPVQARIRDRVIDDVRTSVLLTGAGIIAITAIGVTLIASDSRRRRDDGQP